MSMAVKAFCAGALPDPAAESAGNVPDRPAAGDSAEMSAARPDSAADSAGHSSRGLPRYEIIVKGFANSLTSPPLSEASKKKGEVAGGFTVKDAGGFQQGRSATLQEFLQDVPGIFMQASSGGEVSKVSMRGSGIQAEDQPIGIQFLLDGMPYNDAEGEAVLEDFNLNGVKYAEVFRGANAFTYGSYALGGAVNLVPLTGYDAGPLYARIDGGSSSYMNALIASGGIKGPVDYYLSTTAHLLDGFRAHSNENGEQLFGNCGLRIGNSLETRLYLTAGAVDRAAAGGLTKDEMAADPRQADPDAIAQDFHKTWEMARCADKVTYQSGENRIDGGLFWAYRNEMDRSYFGPGSRQGIYAFYDNNFGISLNYVNRDNIFGRKNMLTVGSGLTYENENGANYENVNGSRGALTAQGLRMSLNAPLYGEIQHHVLDGLSAVAGVQAVYAQRRFVDRSPAADGDAGDRDKVQDFFGANPKAGLILEFADDNKAFVNASRSWQPPSFDELVEMDQDSGGGYEYAPLRPQQAWTLELGTRGGRGRFEWELAAYRSWVTNELLAMNDTHGNDIGTVNVAATVHQGIEAGLDVDLLYPLFVHGAGRGNEDRITLSQAYTLNDFHFQNDSVYRYNRIGGIPMHWYEAELLYQTPAGLFAGVNLASSLSRFPVDQANTLFADPYVLLGLKIGFQQKKGFTVYFEAKNLLDARYPASVDPIADATTVNGPVRIFQPGDGRSFYGGVRWAW